LTINDAIQTLARAGVENSSKMMPNVYFDWMSLSAIQNHPCHIARRRVGDVNPFGLRNRHFVLAPAIPAFPRPKL
jgi:hypothetical protein